MIHVQCRSHYVSHFAAFFIVARAKISVVESCIGFLHTDRTSREARQPHECLLQISGRLRRRLMCSSGVVGWYGRGGREPLPYSSLVGRMCGIDPSAGSPTETLLRLLLPLNDKVQTSFGKCSTANRTAPPVPSLHRTIQSVGATGGVYKGQGRNQCTLMTCVY